MVSLVLKEWRQLRPISIMWLALMVIGFATLLFTNRFDEMHYLELCQDYCDAGVDYATTIAYAIFVIIVAYSLFPREHDESTIDFLKSLPVSRGSIFIAKVLAAWMLIVVLLLVEYVVSYLLSTLRTESIDGKNYYWITLNFVWREWVYAFVLLAHGIFLSWFRTLGLVIYAAYLTLVLTLEKLGVAVGPYNVLRILSNEYHGQNLVVASETIITQVAIAVFLLVVSYFLWSRTESRAATKTSNGRFRIWLNRVVAVGAFTAISILIFSQLLGQQQGLVSTDLKVVETKHYRFVYNPVREPTVEFLQEHADVDLQMLADLLNTDANTLHIQADLTSDSAHAAGLAQWKKIEVNLDSFETDVEQRRVLSHETAHVFQSVLSNRRINNHGNAAKFFVEGMAQQLSFTVLPLVDARSQNWSNAAVAMSRQNIRFEDLIDATTFATKFDAELVYSIGDLWAESMVSVCGIESFGDWLRAIGRPDAATDIPALLFWNDSMQYINCDISAVNRAWHALAEEILASVDQQLYPEFSNIAVTQDVESNTILITANVSSDGPLNFRIRVSDPIAFGKVIDPIFNGRILNQGSDEPIQVEYRIPRRVVSGSRFQFQLGFVAEAGARIFYDRWQSASISNR